MRNLYLSLIFLNILTTSCKSVNHQSELQDATGTGGIPGIPKFYLGVMDLVSRTTTFDSGHKTPSTTITSQMVSISGTNGLGLLTPIKCSDAEKMATGKSSITSADLCHVELLGTGRISPDLNGVALHIIALDKQGKGFDPSTFTLATAPLTPGPVVNVSSGPSSVPNAGLDDAVVGDAIQRLKTKFKLVNNGKLASIGQDCLKNARAGGWSDIQAHYYCTMPYTIRFCYSTILGEQKDPVKAFNYCSNKSNESDWIASRDSMFHNYAPGSADWKWLVSDQQAEFKYVMFTRSGTKDYNIEDQNKLINEIYGTSSPRPRRAIDTYPAWSANQPRYDQLRGGSAAAPAQLPPAPLQTPVQPAPLQQQGNAPVVPTTGLYAEENNLESVNCTARLDSIEEHTDDGLRFLLKMTGGPGCSVNGSVFSAGIKGTISCVSASVDCRYETKLVTGNDFVLDAEVSPNGKITVFSKTGEEKFVWSRIAP